MTGLAAGFLSPPTQPATDYVTLDTPSHAKTPILSPLSILAWEMKALQLNSRDHKVFRMHADCSRWVAIWNAALVCGASLDNRGQDRGYTFECLTAR